MLCNFQILHMIAVQMQKWLTIERNKEVKYQPKNPWSYPSCQGSLDTWAPLTELVCACPEVCTACLLQYSGDNKSFEGEKPVTLVRGHIQSQEALWHKPQGKLLCVFFFCQPLFCFSPTLQVDPCLGTVRTHTYSEHLITAVLRSSFWE